MSRATPSSYSPLQIGLHWVIAALVLVQIVFGDWIGHLGRALDQGLAPDLVTRLLGTLHVWIGIAILALTGLRLALRLGRGAPAPLGGTPLTLRLLTAAHALFYALLLAMPVSGLIAWYGGVPVAGEVHEAMKPVLVLLVALHLLAVLWHRVVLRDDTMARMLRPGR
ncbi:cytochrome b [Microvirga tunisiensis]|uniref:Cytochrome b n=1 Tax=Pannonibacter tanglangensis TaxID=2750084 RepID=A0A7X5J801_9HYPH|nr:cytochrome b/b6 domain-containing protein [Pannonibacter sp. XCT-53]NBN76951.1 cytochrome b [Pannonibacter sp. XCT-53]